LVTIYEKQIKELNHQLEAKESQVNLLQNEMQVVVAHQDGIKNPKGKPGTGVAVSAKNQQ
jgi:hypothetical protein